jgi:quercetin dioxygenase-like cupin family protein
VLHGFQFINRSRLAPGASHEPHQHDDHEEVFYIVGGAGAVLLGTERHPVREGDAVYVPVGTPHGLINDSADWLDFLAIGGPIIA